MPGGVFSAPEHLPPPLKIVKKPQEEIDKGAQRLSTPRKEHHAHDDHLLAPKVVKTTAAIESAVEKLYTQAMEHQKRVKAKHAADEDAAAKATQKILSEDEVMDGVNRLYGRTLEQRKLADEKLREKYLFSPKKSPRKTTPAESNNRVYTAALERKREKESKLYEKYVTKSMPSPRKLTAAEQTACGSRLSTSPRGEAAASSK